MPIVMIHAHPPKEKASLKAILTEIQEEGAKALHTTVDNIWPAFFPFQPGHYPENLSPFVIVKAHRGRTPQMKEEFMRVISKATARGLSLPSEKIWIHYQETEPKDVWFQDHWGA